MTFLQALKDFFKCPHQSTQVNVTVKEGSKAFSSENQQHTLLAFGFQTTNCSSVAQSTSNPTKNLQSFPKVHFEYTLFKAVWFGFFFNCS